MMAGTGQNPMLPGPASRTTRLPLVLDIVMNISQIFVLIVAIVTAIVSIMTKVDAITVIMRTAVAILAVGLPVFLLNYLIGKFYIQATLEEMKAVIEGASQDVRQKSEESGAGDTQTGEMDTQA